MLKETFEKAKDKLLHNDGIVFTFLRSTISSQVCSWIDMLTSFVLFAFFDLTPWLSTATGAFVGGICNCIVNYKFTFHAQGVLWRAAIVKFLFVWTGSMLLNSFGTQFLYYLLRDWTWLKDTFDIGEDAIFLAARLTVSLAVSLAWNFQLQRTFVFRESRADKYIVKALDRMFPIRHSESK